jgi:hypothetical protein
MLAIASFVSTEIMACHSPLGETEREVTAASVAEVGNVADVMLTRGGGGAPLASVDKGRVLSGGESVDEGASDIENSWMYCFGASTITQGYIREMVNKGYFAEGEARA